MWVFWVLFAVAATALVLIMVKVEQRRLKAHVAEYRAAAARFGAAYAYDAPDGLLERLKGFDLTYADGTRLPQSVRDVFTLEDGTGTLHVFLHEHRGSLPGEAAGGAHRETVACVVSPVMRLPRFRLSPERPVEKIASLLGLRDIDFDSHPGFSKSYYLNAEDEAAIRRLFGPKVLDFFGNLPGLHVEGRGDTLIVYRFRNAIGPEELPDFLKMVRRISELVRG